MNVVILRTKVRCNHNICTQLLLIILTTLIAGAPGHAAPGGGGGGPPPGKGPTCPPACPANPANCDANLVLSRTVSLQFGSIAAPTAGTGDVIVDTAGTRTATGTVVLLPGATVSAASFSMSTGLYNCTARNLVTVTAGPSATLVHSTSPANTMTVDTFTTIPVAGNIFDPTIPLQVGATLHVNPLQLSGSYSGSYTVTVTFQ